MSPRTDAPSSPESLDDRRTELAGLMAEHRSMLVTHTTRLTGGDRDWAEDVVQETFVKAWRYLDRMTPAHGSVRSWLRRVAHNLVVDGYRAARARPVEMRPELPEPAAAADGDDQVLTGVVVRAALDALPAEYRDVLVETYLHDRTAVQAAAVLGIPVGTVKSRAFYGLRRLRAELSPTTLAG